MADVQFEDVIEWDGNSLSVWAVTHRGRVLCEVPRDTIHTLSIYNDAIGREIQRDRRDILERLQPALIAKIAQATLASVSTEIVPLFPEDLSGQAGSR